MFLFDTDHLSILQGQSSAEYQKLRQRMRPFALGDFYCSIVSFHEQALGANTYISRARSRSEVIRGYIILQQVVGTYATSQVLPFEQQAVDRFDQLRAQRIRIGTMDLRIAATALVHGLTALTRNIVDFQQVPGLTVEDWTS